MDDNIYQIPLPLTVHCAYLKKRRTPQQFKVLISTTTGKLYLFLTIFELILEISTHKVKNVLELFRVNLRGTLSETLCRHYLFHNKWTLSYPLLPSGLLGSQRCPHGGSSVCAEDRFPNHPHISFAINSLIGYTYCIRTVKCPLWLTCWIVKYFINFHSWSK